ncbi:MAG: pentapeptide repeat-containing protein, partial [Candidatus Cybelea sp.]
MIPLILAVIAGLPTNCTGCSFAGRDLHGTDLAGASYVGVDFARTNLRDANLQGAKLVGVDFRDADLRGADLRNANLTGADFSGARMHGAQFGSTNLTGANLRDATNGLDDADLRGLLWQCVGCDARGASLAGRDLSG